MSAPRVVVVAQARMGSSRLPGKVLREAGGQSLLHHLAARVLSARLPSALVIATTDQPSDDPIAAARFPEGVSVFRGDEHDVLRRYAGAARAAGAEVVVRVTGDCPLLDPEELDRVVGLYLEARTSPTPLDYVTNQAGEVRRIPRGLDVEVMSAEALYRAEREAAAPGEREHVTPYLYQSGRFRVRVTHPEGEDLSDLRLTVDTPEDLALVRAVLEELGPRPTTAAVAALLRARPELVALNAHVKQRGVQSEHERRRSLAAGRLLVGRADRSFEGGAGHVARLSGLLAAWARLGGEAACVGDGLDEFWRARLSSLGVRAVSLEGRAFAEALAALRAESGAPLAGVCVDGYALSPADLEAVRACGAPLCLVDDHAAAPLEWYEAASVVVNQNLGFDVGRYPSSVRGRVLAGGEFVLLRPEFWGALGAGEGAPASPTPPWPPGARRVVVTFGSSDPARATAPLLEALEEALEMASGEGREGRERVCARVVVGPSFDPVEVRRLRALAARAPWVSLVEGGEGLAGVFAGAEVAVTAGGTTVWELLRCGVWPLVVRVAENQDVVGEGLRAVGVGADLGVAPRAGDREGWARVAQAALAGAGGGEGGAGLVDGRGVWRVIDRVLGI